MKRAVIFLFDGFEEIEAVIPIDILRRANIEVTIASISAKKEVFGGRNIAIICDDILVNLKPENFDLIILPGGTTSICDCEELGLFLQKANDLQKIIAAICAAPLALEIFNILQNRKFTCYPGYEKEITSGKFTGNEVEVCENLVTSRGVGTALNFSLTLLKVLNLNEIAATLESAMLIKERLNDE